METILIVGLLISVLYLIFANKHTGQDISDLYYKLDVLSDRCKENEQTIKELQRQLKQSNAYVKRRESADKYRRVFKAAISQCFVYCNNGWSVSKTLLSKVKSEAYRVFERGIRPSYIRAKQIAQRFVYRVKKGQEVLSYQRTEDVYSERFR